MSDNNHWTNEKIILYRHIDHDNIVKIIDSDIKMFDHGRYIFLVLEYMPEGDLRSHLKNSTMKMKQCIFLATSLVKAVSYIHSNRSLSGEYKIPVVHQDIKSTNV